MKEGLCPICGSADIVEYYRGVSDYMTGEKFDVSRCRACDVGFTNPQPRSMEKYYPRKYRRYNNVVQAVLGTLYRLRVSRWDRLFRTPGSALEIGCGDGLMLDALRKKGWTVAGTERTEEMADVARKNLGLKVHVGGAGQIPADEAYELIILFQVLEHLNDPLDTLKQCAAHLKPDGKLLVALPNLASWQSRYAKSLWFHLDVPRHLFHFSPTSLGHAMRLAGLAVTRTSFVSFEHDPYGWVQSILNKMTGDRNRLTRLLMRVDELSVRHLFSVAAASVLALPGLTLSWVSWLLNRGAIIQVACEHESNDARTASKSRSIDA